MSTRRDFLKKTALFGASMVAAPSLMAGGREEGSFFVPGQEGITPAPAAGNALRISGTFLDEISHDIPHQNWGEKEWDRDFRHMRAIGIDTVIMIRSGYRKFITYPSKYLMGKGCYEPGTDLLDMFLRLTDKHGMKFYFGLYDSGRYWDTGDLSWEIEDNKYVIDEVWQQKVQELHEMGMEYLVFMAVANEGRAYYPSLLMPHVYPEGRKSPVDAIMDAAARFGMKVFMSTGWAKDQDDNLRDPAIRRRQQEMMQELAGLYGHHPALYGWYLPVEDCLCPLLSEHAVTAVNALTDKARSLTPGKKILISPYGLVDSDFTNPEYERRLSRLKVDIIAYQDEVGCVREPFPMPRLKENWKKLRDIHNRLNIAFWANCETFTWEKATNDRTSALIPAAYQRLLSQQVAASVAGVECIISFMFCGIIEKPDSPFQLGQPYWSGIAYRNYMDWLNGGRYWRLLEASHRGTLGNGIPVSTTVNGNVSSPLLDGRTADENPDDSRWMSFGKGRHELTMDFGQEIRLDELFLRLLDYRPGMVTQPDKVYFYVSSDGTSYRLLSVRNAPCFPNAGHDAWIDGILLETANVPARYLKLVFDSPHSVLMDELYVNPTGLCDEANSDFPDTD